MLINYDYKIVYFENSLNKLVLSLFTTRSIVIIGLHLNDIWRKWMNILSLSFHLYSTCEIFVQCCVIKFSEWECSQRAFRFGHFAKLYICFFPRWLLMWHQYGFDIQQTQKLFSLGSLRQSNHDSYLNEKTMFL